jgi:hypothetical protein
LIYTSSSRLPASKNNPILFKKLDATLFPGILVLPNDDCLGITPHK